MNDGLLPGVGSGNAGTRGRFAYTLVEISSAITPPVWAKWWSMYLCGGGGGGGGGRYSTTDGASGGGGGAGAGSRFVERIPVFPTSNAGGSRFVVTIGAGGTGGSGSAVSGTNGTNGTNGSGSSVEWYFGSVVSTNSRNIAMWYTDSNGGAGGGTTTAGTAGAAGISSTMQTPGYGGGSGTTAASPSYNGTNSTNDAYPHRCQSGFGAPGKNNTFYVAPEIVPASLGGGYPFPNYATVGINGEDGVDSETYGRKWHEWGLSQLTSAPSRYVWFMSHIGGYAGGSGTTSGTAVKGGNGGKGWRGTGGGGGAGAGMAGVSSGNGGAGGNGVALFFWEEY